jgi:DNA relaxase NicK
MFAKIDYITYTVPCAEFFELGDLDHVQRALNIFSDFSGDWTSPIRDRHSWEVYKAKGFYHTRVFHADSKVSVSFGNVNRHVYIEIGGQACDYIRAHGSIEDLLKRIGTRASRIDFAVDMESEMSVRDFIVNRQGQAFKAGGDIFSEDGETSYVGSWKGERFARVYRYHEPHPRSKFLRAEVVLRGVYAKQAVELVLTEGEVTTALVAHKPFGWSASCWEPEEISESVIKSQRSDKENASTIRWLFGDVVSSIIKNHNEGLIDAREMFERLIAPKLIK